MLDEFGRDDEFFVSARLDPEASPWRGRRGPKGVPMFGPNAVRAMQALETHIRSSGLEPALVHLVTMRASRINGCAYRLDMHWKDDLVSLSLAVVAINGWNRLCTGFRAVPGAYQPGRLRATSA